jgi:hypothetical protein
LSTRDVVVDVLRRELLGPDPQGAAFDFQNPEVLEAATAWMPRRQTGSGEEILVRDSPDRRYGIGVLYSAGGRALREPQLVPGDGPSEEGSVSADQSIVSPEFLKAVDALDEIGEEAPSHDLDLSGANEFRPSTMAVSLLVELPEGAKVKVTVSGGRYSQREVAVGNQARSWWFRSPLQLEAEWLAGDLMASPGRRLTEGKGQNLQGLSLDPFMVSRPRHDGTSLITVGVINRTPGSTPNHFVFQVGLKVEAVGTSGKGLVLPYPEATYTTLDEEQKSIELLYRDLPTFAVGHGCAAGWKRKAGEGRCFEVTGEPLPMFETPSITPQVFRKDGTELRVPMAPLAGLVAGQDGLDGVREVIDLYDDWISAQEKKIPLLTSVHRGTAGSHLAACRVAADRMRLGLQLVVENEDVKKAFVLANEAVLLQQIHSAGTTRELVYDDRTKSVSHSEAKRPVDPLSPPGGRGSWRPFQIAFLLAAIPSTADSSHEDRDLVDLIFFPTGGGKTEAYLALSAFSIFLRRIRNPDDEGVEVLMRYTLRLLTAQQFQRAAALICAMETIRRTMPSLGSRKFSIGIWVGSETTPNTRKQALTDLRGLRASKVPNPFLVIRCPWCAAQIGPLNESGKRLRSKAPRVLGYEEVEGSVRISCTDPECEFATGLPVCVIDEDIYAHTPSIVIGTVDKFAQLSWRSNARSLFGLGPDGDHVVSPPGLIIQDELHLISGPLGSMVGLYEAVIDELCTAGDVTEQDRRRPKVVSSTATIRKYAEQVRALFARDRVALFPPHGIDAEDSFFARYATFPSGHPREGRLREGRMYVGIHGGGLGSLQTAQVRTFAALLQAGMDLPESERDPYWTLMVFFNSLRELGTSLSLLQSDIPDYLKVIHNRRGSSWEDVRRLNRELELTGRLRNDEVPAVMEALDNPYGSGGEVVDVCLASNIIEVGIDIDRLSVMTVVGQPKSTSQYIQVTGRVGRRWEERPGLIATIYSPTKPRDRSHYEKFRSYHERLYAQVEPTSVTPFAPPVLRRALHAVLIAWVRQRVDLPSVVSPYPVPDTALATAQAILERRVNKVDPEEAAALALVLASRIKEWETRLPGDWRRQTDSSEPGLMYSAGDYADPEQRRRSWAVPTSLRNVDAECQGVITGIYALGTPDSNLSASEPNSS